MGDAAVIGAGVLGLAVAQRLRERGEHVTVFESAAQPGGRTTSWTLGDPMWDRHHHVILPTDSRTMVLLRSLGLDREIRWSPASWGFYGGPQLGLRPLSTARDLLRLPMLGALDKVRVAATTLSGSRRATNEALEGRSARAWLLGRDGRRTFERLWRPLLEARLGGDWRYASASFVAASMGRVHAMRRAGRVGLPAGGYGRLFDRFASSISDAGVKIDYGRPVVRIRPTGRGLEVYLDDGVATFDRVVVTTSAPLAADMCPEVSPGELERLRSVRYVGAVTASLVLPRRLSPYFQTMVGDDSTAPLGSIVETTPFGDRQDAVVHLSAYAPADDPLFDEPDAAVMARLLDHLRVIHPHFDDGEVVGSRVARARHALAVPTLDYSRSMPRTTTTIPGLQLIGSANLPTGSANLNAVLGLLEELR